MKRLTMFLIGTLLMCPLSFATPPSDLSLTCDLAAGTITIQGHHPSQDRLKHYIRRLAVTKNQEKPQTFYFTHQNSASEFKQIVSLKIKAGDKIHAQVFCSLGGSSEADLLIPDDQKKKDLKATVELKATKGKEHKGPQVIP